MPEGGAHFKKLSQSKGSGDNPTSLDESRPAGRTPNKICGRLWLQKGGPHNRTMLVGAPGADPGGHTEKESKRDVGGGKEEDALPNLS